MRKKEFPPHYEIHFIKLLVISDSSRVPQADLENLLSLQAQIAKA
jgi:hypothetical protein